MATENAGHACEFWTGDRGFLCTEVKAAGSLHDCGKLAPENQEVLARSSKDPLPVRHEDAGAAWLLERRSQKAAMLVASHHSGLPSESEEGKKAFMKPAGKRYRLAQTIEHTDRHMAKYAAEYEQAGVLYTCGTGDEGRGWSGLTHRMALSCLVDADHTDTAANYQQAVPKMPAKLRWAERADALDQYVRDLSIERKDDPRNGDRRVVYERCALVTPESGIVSCDAAVGSGKTTAVMAHLLQVAERKKLRHIFVVLPYTNIIQQSVEVYRKALVLDGEDPTEVVAEVHHRAEFQDPDLREMSVLWDAPITVTTAVQFFETLAANKPARLRKLHELAGSAIFIDEVHAAIPTWLWPQTWLWLKELANDWGCYFVLASGSLAKFWENRDFVHPQEGIPDLLTPEIRARLAKVEEQRIQVLHHPQPLTCSGLSGFVSSKTGPRLVILNTVQSAAVLADHMHTNKLDVMHLSTALAPGDREKVVERVRERLKDKVSTDWTLVATSCVECGVDFSFRTAIRESCSVASLIQTSGRVNRNGDWTAAEVWDVRLGDPMFNQHPGFRDSREVLRTMMEQNDLRGAASAVVTEALRQELIRQDVRIRADELRSCETAEEWAAVAKQYRVIDADTQTVVVDAALVERLKKGERVPWRELVRGSVQIWRKKVQSLALLPVQQDGELFYWTGPYEPEFLGYMAGVLPLIQGKDTGLYG